MQDENGWIIACVELKEPEWRKVRRDRFFNWWAYGSLAGEVWDQSYASIDPKDDKVDERLIPQSDTTGYHINIFGGDMRRVYFMEPAETGGRLYFYYLKW